MINYKVIDKPEIELIRLIDRSEEIHEIYYYRNGKLELEKEFYSMKGFPIKELDIIIDRQLKIFNSGGQIIGAFDGEKMVGVASVENKRRGNLVNYYKMDILFVSKDYRKMNIGTRLVEECKTAAKSFGAGKLYISATPSKNTVDFYIKRGALLVEELNSELFKLEPEDIHLELKL